MSSTLTTKSVRSARIAWIDVCRGAVLLSVILGHCTPNTTYYGIPIRGIIFSFHMPLFFMLSGYTFHCSDSMGKARKKLGRGAKSLLLTALICYIIRTSVLSIGGILFGGGYSVEQLKTSVGNLFWIVRAENTSSIGMVYFLVILFLSRTIFDYIQLLCPRFKGLICLALCCIGVFLPRIHILPFAIDMAFAMTVFIYLGYSLSRIEHDRKLLETIGMCIISFMVWVGTFALIYAFSGTYFELAHRRYPMFPLSFVCAVAGSCFAFSISIIIYKRFGQFILLKLLKYIGNNSIVFFLVHYFDAIWKAAFMHGNWLITFALRTVVDFAIFVVVIKFLELRKKGKEKKNV